MASLALIKDVDDPPRNKSCHVFPKGEIKIQRVIPLTKDRYVLGRSSGTLRGHGEQIRIDSIHANKWHAAIYFHAGKHVLRDLATRNGTYRNGSLIDCPVALRDGDQIFLGGVVFLYQSSADEAGEAHQRGAAEELVDVIDDAGNPIAEVPRSEMRFKRLPHRCTYVLVFNTYNELFIHMRTASKDVYPSYWDVCIGGVLAAGETFAQGAKREIREELGIDADAEQLFTIRYSDELTIVHGMVYQLKHDGPFQLQVEEIVRGEFVSMGEVKERIRRESFCPDGLAVLRTYWEY